MEELVRNYGYAGVFLVLLISNASILFPLPGTFIIFVAGAILNPWGVALAAGLGGTVGEFTGYLLGRGGGKLVERRAELSIARNTFKKYGSWSIYIFAALPLPFDIVGLVSGALRIHPLIFFLLTFAGKTTAFTMYAFTGREATELLTGLFEGRFSPYALGFLAVTAAFIIGAAVAWNYLLEKHNNTGN